MTDKIIDKTLKIVFSVPSFFVHAAIFICQLAFHVNQNAITNYISWEAIFLAILIGIQAIRHAHETKEHINHKLKEVTNESKRAA